MIERLKQVIREVPGAHSAIRIAKARRFPGSAPYWEKRYATGGTSGDGSYGPLAEFKAGVLNQLVSGHGLKRVVEFGCGDGAQLQLAHYPEYVGLDVAPSALRRCIKRFRSDPTKSFFLYDPSSFQDNHGIFAADVALSLDVIYHLVEDDTFDTYMTHLFGSAHKFVAIYSSNHDEAFESAHVRHRKFSSWIAARAQSWALVNHIENPYTDPNGTTHSQADFWIYGRSVP